MRDWYERYYAAVERSAAYAEFCRRVFGANLGQHGFADMDQVRLLVEGLNLRAGDRILDLGCGNGGIIAGIAVQTGADVVGLDYSQYAIAGAQARYASPHIQFVAADIGAVCFEAASFDAVMGIDALYFTPTDETVAAVAALLRPGGRMAFLYSHGADPEHPLPSFDRGALPPYRTPLGVALRRQGLSFTTHDLTEDDRRHALRKKQVLEALELAFIMEGNEFLYRNRYGEANGVLAAIEAGAHARYLYLATKPTP